MQGWVDLAGFFTYQGATNPHGQARYVTDSIGERSVCFCFYPRNAMLARVLAVGMCLSVCLSVSVTRTPILYISTEQVLVYGLFSTYPIHYSLRKLRYLQKIMVLLSRTLFQSLRLEISSWHECKKRAKVVDLSLTTLGTVDVAWCCQQSTNDFYLLIALSVQLCVQRDGQLGVTDRVARVRRHQLRPVVSLSVCLPVCLFVSVTKFTVEKNSSSIFCLIWIYYSCRHQR